MRMVRVREKVFRNSTGFRFNVSFVDCSSVFVKSVLKQFLRSVNISRTNGLQTKPKDSNDVVPFVFTYNTALPRICKILLKHFNILQSSSRSKDVFKKSPFVAYRRNALIFVTFQLKHNYPLSPKIIFRQASSALDKIVSTCPYITNGLTSYTFYATGETRSIHTLLVTLKT